MRGAALIVCLALFLPPPSLAAEVTKVPGRWSFSGEGQARLGLSYRDGNLHPYFFYAACNNRDRATYAFIEIPPADFVGLIAAGKYLRLLSRNANSQIELLVDSIHLNEAGPYAWVPTFKIDRPVLEQWAQPGRLEIQIGERTRGGFLVSKSYELPEQNRTVAAKAFISACFDP